MKNLQTFTEFAINEADRKDRVILQDEIDKIKDKLNGPTKDEHDPSFDVNDLKSHIEKSHDQAEEDTNTVKQTIKANKELKAGDFVIHKDRQALGIGNIQKIHKNKTHADIHFVNGLQSSLADDKEQTKTDLHKMELKHLMPVIGTQG